MTLQEPPLDVAGIRISKEVSVTTALGDETNMVRDMLQTKVESGSHDQQFGPRLRKLSNSSSIISDIFKHPDLSEDRLKRRIKEADSRPSPKDLIDFLRNMTPPPGNYMSIPDSYDSSSTASSDGGGPWRSIKKALRIRKKKKRSKPQPRVKRRPIEIRLPDSAVAGRTIGGHRHIAISIPVEYAYTDSKPSRKATDDEAADDEGERLIRMGTVPAKTVETRSGLVRLNSDRGVVTVLKPVVESRESIDNMLGQASGPVRGVVLAKRPHTAHADTVLGSLPRAGERRVVSDVPNITFTRGDDDGMRPHTADAATVSSSGGDNTITGLHPSHHGPKESVSSFISIGGNSIAGGGKLTFPARRSSLGHTTYTHHRSYSHSSVEHGGPSARESAESFLGRRHRRGLSSIDSNFGTRASIADSIATDGTEPVIVDASTARAYASPTVVAVVASEGPTRTGGDRPTAGTSNRLSAVTDPETVRNVSVHAEEDYDEKRLSIASMPETGSYLEHLDVQRRSYDDGRRRGNASLPLINDFGPLSIPQRRWSKRQGELEAEHELHLLRIEVPQQEILPRSNSTRSAVETLVNRPGMSQILSMAPITTVADTKPSASVTSPTETANTGSTPTTIVRDETFLTTPSTVISPSAISAMAVAGTPRRTNSARESRIRLPVGPEPRTSSLRPHIHTRMTTSAIKEPLSPNSPSSNSLNSPRTMVTVSSPPQDRISLSRRRERAVEKEQLHAAKERLAREVEALRLRTELAQREEQVLARSSSHAELMRKYEVLREVREHDLETRLAQLERNGEAWLKLFDRLNRNLQTRGHGSGRTYGLGFAQPSWEELKMQELLQDYRTRQERERERFQAQKERRRLDRLGGEEGLDEKRGRASRRSFGDGAQDDNIAENDDTYLDPRRRHTMAYYDLAASRSPVTNLGRENQEHRVPSRHQNLEEHRYRPISTGTSNAYTHLRPSTMAGMERQGSAAFTGASSSLPRSRTLHGQTYPDTPAHPVRTPLQDEFEAELARRREFEALGAEIDARMSESTAAGWRGGPEFADFNDDVREPGRAGRHSVDLGGYVDDSYRASRSSASGLDTLEPLMRELMGAARMDMGGEDGVLGGAVGLRGGEMDDENESVLSAEAEYLFEEF